MFIIAWPEAALFCQPSRQYVPPLLRRGLVSSLWMERPCAPLIMALVRLFCRNRVRPTIVALGGLVLGRRRGGPGAGPAREDRRPAPLGLGAPEGVPAPGALHRPQTGHRLRPRATPAHPGPFLPRRDQRLVRTLDHPGANRELAGYKARVVHPRRVVGEVLLRFADLLRSVHAGRL